MSTSRPLGPHRDTDTGDLLKDMREELGLSRAQLPHAMRRAGVPRDHIPSVRTLWDIEERGHIPRVRLMYGLAQFHNRTIADLWGSASSRRPAHRRVVIA